MKSPVVFGVLGACLIAGAVLGYLYLIPTLDQRTETKKEAPTPREAGATILLTLRDGRTVSVPDFTYNHPQVDAEGVTYVLLTQTPEGVEEDTRYGIVFGTDSTFTIGLFEEPFGASRRAAEEKLLKLLGLPEVALCTLDVSVGVPDTIGGAYAGKNLGLSFCPKAIPLP